MDVFSPLNEQTATRWKKTLIKPGLNTFTWHYNASHATACWQFYITNKDWNPNRPLSRESFELKPLLDEKWNNTVPVPAGGTTPHKVYIPADHGGYHVILATWKAADTDATFYQVIDLDIDNGKAPPSDWQHIGTVQPQALKIGDEVFTRAFVEGSELQARQVGLKITSAEESRADVWPYLLAKKVNATNPGFLMGELNVENQVVPNFGMNGFFVKKGSDITSVLVKQVLAEQPGELKVDAMRQNYTLKNGKVDLHFNAIARGVDYTIKATVFNAKGESIAHQQAEAGNNTPQFSITLEDIMVGKFDLVIIATRKKGAQLQHTVSFTVQQESDAQYDHVFPASLKSYVSGTRVLQPKDGKIYECKPFPNSGHCIQWSPSATSFEPGNGANWQAAWSRR